jgi:DNA polymerase-4
VTLKLRDGHFKTMTRSRTLDHPTNLTRVLWLEARAVLLQWHAKSPRALRLLGFGASGLSAEGSGQGQLFFDPDEEKQKKLDQAFDAIRNRYGKDALKHGE